MMKFCNKCKKDLPIDLFGLRNKSGTARTAYCKYCKRELSRVWKQKNRAYERSFVVVDKSYKFDLVEKCIARWYA